MENLAEEGDLNESWGARPLEVWVNGSEVWAEAPVIFREIVIES